MGPPSDPLTLANALAKTLPLEQGGPRAQAGFAYQASCAIDEILEIHALSGQYILFLDHHDDLVVVTPNGRKFVQVKTTGDACFTWADLLSKGDSGQSILSKLYCHAVRFPSQIHEIVLLSNKPFFIKHGKRTRSDKLVESFRVSDLPAALLIEYHEHIGQANAGCIEALEYCPLVDKITHGKKSHLDLKTHQDTMAGRTAHWLESLGFMGADEQRAFYRTLRDEIMRRAATVVNGDIGGSAKSISRTEVEQMIDGLCRSNHKTLREKTIAILDSGQYTQGHALQAKTVLDKYATVDLPSPFNTSLQSISELVQEAVFGKDPRIMTATTKRELTTMLLDQLSPAFGDIIPDRTAQEIILLYEVLRAQDK